MLLPTPKLPKIVREALTCSQLDFTIPTDYMINYLLSFYAYYKESHCTFEEALYWLTSELQSELPDLDPSSLNEPDRLTRLTNLYDFIVESQTEICQELQPIDHVFTRGDYQYAEVWNEAKGALVIAIYRAT